MYKISQLRGVYYKWKSEVEDTLIGANAKRNIGFLAQEVLPILPEAVDTNFADTTLAVDYASLTGLLIEGIKDLDTKVGRMEYWKKDTANANISYATGNVGIGTSEPAYTLDVKGNLKQYDTYLHEDSSITVAGIFSSAQEENIHLGLTISDTVLSKINFSNKSIDLHYMQGSLNTDFSVGKNGVIIAGSLEINNGTQNNGYVLTSDSFGLATWQPSAYSPWDTLGTSIVQKDTTLSVGIGTTHPHPQFALDVAGGAYIHTPDSLEVIRLEWGNKYGTLTAWNILQVQNDGVIIGANDNTQNVGSYIQAKSSGDIIINPITTRDIGNVGIGTFSPTARLHVYANYDAAIPTKAGYFYATGGTSANYGIHAYAPVSSGNYAAYLQGDAIVTGTMYTPSDEKLKTNIRRVSNNTLDKINKLGVASYEFNSDMRDKHNFPQGLQIGIMAQDIEKQWPQLVRTDKHQQLDTAKAAVPKFDEFKVVNYNGLIPILVKGIQELDATIDSLKALVAENAILKAENEDLKKDVAGIKDMLTKFGDDLQYCCFNQGTNQHTPTGDNNKLEQNNPNPFSENTTIRYYITAQSKEAVIRISNLNGTVLNTFKIDAKGAGQILVSGNSLKAGTYIYELIVDGKQIDAKRMVLTY